MIQEFDKLNDQEIELVFKAPILVCILIAGADGTIDRKEIKEAMELTRRGKRSSGILEPFLKELTQDFEDKLKITIQSYPYESTQRTPVIVDELQGLNKTWTKLPKPFSKAYYELLKEIATKIAESSGGLLWMNSVGAEEAKFMKLSMIHDPSV